MEYKPSFFSYYKVENTTNEQGIHTISVKVKYFFKIVYYIFTLISLFLLLHGIYFSIKFGLNIWLLYGGLLLFTFIPVILIWTKLEKEQFIEVGEREVKWNKKSFPKNNIDLIFYHKINRWRRDSSDNTQRLVIRHRLYFNDLVDANIIFSSTGDFEELYYILYILKQKLGVNIVQKTTWQNKFGYVTNESEEEMFH